MLLAAGRGERMRPLTDRTPKPLLAVGGKPLIVRHIDRLAAAGFADIVINHAHLGEQLVAALGDGSGYGVRIVWSAEPPGALETAGGIAKALPLLGDAPFLVINADIHCDWSVDRARALGDALQHADRLAHLVLVANPAHHQQGDFVLDGPLVRDDVRGAERLTFAGIGVYHPLMFARIVPGTRAPLAPLLREAMAAGKVGGERHGGEWTDVGTPQRLAELDDQLSRRGGAVAATGTGT